MYKTKILLAIGILLLVVGCGDSVVDPVAEGAADVNASKALNRYLETSPAGGPAAASCEDECIEPDTGVYYPVGETVQSRHGRNTKHVSYIAYNTETQFVVDVTYGVSGPANAHATIIVAVDGSRMTFEDVAPGSTVTHQVDLPPDWMGCDELSYTIRQEGLGRPVEFAGTYALIPVCRPEPVLWNELGSLAEVENSEIGPGGTAVGDVNFDHDVRFGKGITPNTGYARSGVDFPVSVVDPERGAVEMWVQAYHYPQPYSHGVYGLVNVSHWRPEPGRFAPLTFDWYNGSPGKLQFVLKFNGTPVSLTLPSFDPGLDTPVHVAAVWDRDGIDDSGDYMRIYVDGVLAAASAESNAWGTELETETFRVATTWDGNFGTDRFSVDHLKVWDFARTDFSDLSE